MYPGRGHPGRGLRAITYPGQRSACDLRAPHATESKGLWISPAPHPGTFPPRGAVTFHVCREGAGPYHFISADQGTDSSKDFFCPHAVSLLHPEKEQLRQSVSGEAGGRSRARARTVAVAVGYLLRGLFTFGEALQFGRHWV